MVQHPKLLTVKQFSSKHSAFSVYSLRNLIADAENRYSSKGEISGNGLAPAIVRIGRRVLLDEDKFFEWVNQKNGETHVAG